MKIESLIQDQSLTLSLQGKLDISTASKFEQALKLDSVKELILDFKACNYVSSVGLRVILIALRTLKSNDGKIIVKNVDSNIYEIFVMTGINQLVEIHKSYREISTDNFELISAGVCGECYRIDKENIVKLYNEGISADIAEKEKKFAREALILGIPTALSYDIVSCGNRTGIIYELLNARLFSEVINADPDNLDTHAKTLVGVAKQIHTAKGDPKIFPLIKNNFRDYINQMDFFLSKDEIDFLLEKLDTIPDSDTCVHFDIHTSNIMMKDNDPLVIDLGDLSIGSYYFDIGLLYMIYGIPELNICQMATKIPLETGIKLWEAFSKNYFLDKPVEDFDYFYNNRYFFASLRIIYTITFLPKLKDELVTMMKQILIPRMMNINCNED